MRKVTAVVVLLAGMTLLQFALRLVREMADRGVFYPANPITHANAVHVEAANFSLASGATAAIIGGLSFWVASLIWKARPR